MKLTSTQLRKIIKEELDSIIDESLSFDDKVAVARQAVEISNNTINDLENEINNPALAAAFLGTFIRDFKSRFNLS